MRYVSCRDARPKAAEPTVAMPLTRTDRLVQAAWDWNERTRKPAPTEVERDTATQTERKAGTLNPDNARLAAERGRVNRNVEAQQAAASALSHLSDYRAQRVELKQTA